MKIKVCGITQVEQLIALQELGIDYAGMIFYQQSSRYVLTKLNSKTIKDAQLKIKKVGVFVNATEEEILTMIKEYDLDLVQLHGDETPSFCERISNKVRVIKAFRISEKNEENIEWLIKPYKESVDFYLFDTYSKNAYGGTGTKFNWQALQQCNINKPFFLSGGIGIDDIDYIKEFNNPFFYGIDLNSKVESEPGVKDLQLIKQILKVKDHKSISETK